MRVGTPILLPCDLCHDNNIINGLTNNIIHGLTNNIINGLTNNIINGLTRRMRISDMDNNMQPAPMQLCATYIHDHPDPY